MTDVRLTATNPEDSSVVPVACNAKGELKLEEPLAFDGNLNGDLTVTGTASFANGNFQILEAGETITQNRVNCGADSLEGYALVGKNNSNSDATLWVASYYDGKAPVFSAHNKDLHENIVFYNDGSASFAGGVDITTNGRQLNESPLVLNNTNTDGYSIYSKSNGTGTFSVATDGSASFAINSEYTKGVNISHSANNSALTVYGKGTASANAITVFDGSGTGENRYRVQLKTDGACEFASGKAGFTAEGNLWCTTVRGDTVILDATSNGLATWASYTPPTRRETIEQKVQNIKDAAIKPSQQLPEE